MCIQIELCFLLYSYYQLLHCLRMVYSIWVYKFFLGLFFKKALRLPFDTPPRRKLILVQLRFHNNRQFSGCLYFPVQSILHLTIPTCTRSKHSKRTHFRWVIPPTVESLLIGNELLLSTYFAICYSSNHIPL